MRPFVAARLLALATLATTACGDSSTPPSPDADADADAGEHDLPPQDGICGDGLVNTPQEACDDANDREGDGCNSDCRASGERVWCIDDLGPARVNVLPRGLAVGPSGDVAVIGRAYEGGKIAAWLEVVDATGAPRWSTRFEGVWGSGVGFTSDGTLVVALYETGERRSRLTLFSAEGTPGIGWTGGSELAVEVSALVVSPRDRIVVAGVSSSNLDEAWVGTFSAGLVLEQQTTYRSTQGLDTSARAVALAPNGTVILGADVVLGPGHDASSPPTTAAIAALLPSGELAWDHVFESRNYLTNLLSVAAMGDGSIVVTGGTGGILSSQVWVASLSAAGELDWEYTGDEDVSPSFGSSVTAASAGDFLLASAVSLEQAFVFTAVFGRHDRERRLLWEREYVVPESSTGAQLSVRSSADRSFLIAGSRRPLDNRLPNRSWLCKHTE